MYGTFELRPTHTPLQVMVSLGEMCAYLPHKKGFPGYATRFVDPAFGFALGWNYLLKYVSVLRRVWLTVR